MKKVKILYPILVFSFLMVYFIALHPIAAFDTDDWIYVCNPRIPLPLIGEWNPTKVFPEFFYHLFSDLGAFFIYPVINNYCYSLSISNGLFICFIMTVYFSEFYFLIGMKYRSELKTSLLVGVIFPGLHFCALAPNGNDMVFPLYAYDLNCIYNYVLCTLLNAALVMHMMRYGGFEKWGTFSRRHRVLLILWIYFAIFSNLYSTVVLAAYVSVELLSELTDALRNKRFSLKDYCSSCKVSLIVLAVWLVSFLVELTGERAAYHSELLLDETLFTAKSMLKWLYSMNRLFILLVAVVAVVGAALFKKINNLRATKSVLALCLTTIYIVLLTAYVDSSYIERADVMLPVMFWGLFLLMILLCEIAEIIRLKNIVLCLLALICVTGSVYYSTHFKEINYAHIPYKKCVAFVDDVITQFQDAERNGQTQTDLVLPVFYTEDNWPIADYADLTFANMMYHHRLTDTLITVKNMVFTEEKNRQLEIPADIQP